MAISTRIVVEIDDEERAALVDGTWRILPRRHFVARALFPRAWRRTLLAKVGKRIITTNGEGILVTWEFNGIDQDTNLFDMPIRVCRDVYQ